MTAETEWPEVTGYSEMMVPPDNPMTAAKVALGQQLYYDQRLSGDGEHSCYGCHLEEYGLTDGRPVAIGAFDRTLTRSSPTMWNVGYYSALYWDGRSTALEKQVQGAWSGGNMGASGEGDAPSMEEISAQLNNIPGYQEQFEDVYGEGATPNNVAMSVAAFMRTIVTTTQNSRYIRFRNGDTTAFNEQEQRGWEVFSQRAQCTNCHAGLLLTDQQFHNIGIGMDAADPDLGRFNVTEEDRDRGAFKTPSLFDISQSAPYFHNGSVPTLEEAVDLMLSGGIENEWRDDAMLAATMEADLTDEEKADLLAFLRALDVDYTIEQPMLP
jgi:cytochrome c peroxidase